MSSPAKFFLGSFFATGFSGAMDMGCSWNGTSLTMGVARGTNAVPGEADAK
jgi:hypothetical protein